MWKEHGSQYLAVGHSIRTLYFFVTMFSCHSVHYNSIEKRNLFVEYMEMLGYIEIQILPVILLGEQGGDPPNFMRFWTERSSGQSNALLCNNRPPEIV